MLKNESVNLDTLASEFELRRGLYGHLEGEALFILEGALAQSGVKLRSVTSRVKELDSFLQKAQRREFRDPIGDTQDIVGLRVVCLFLSDIARIGSVIRESFKVIEEEDKIEGVEVSSFGYMSVHFIATMKTQYAGPRYDHLSDIPFEIQVRTIAMDAWANVSHYLEYKTDEDVPSDMKRDFYALSGLFYVADKHFEMFYASKRQSQENMKALFDPAAPKAGSQQEINLESLSAYLQSKFPSRKQSDSSRVSQLVTELSAAGYTTIGEVDLMIEAASNAFKQYEEDNPPFETGAFADIGVVRISAAIVNQDFIQHSIHFKETETWTKAECQQAIEQEINRYSKYRQLLQDPID